MRTEPVPAASAIGFGNGVSEDHHDGIRWVDYTNISWNPVFCKRCDICVDICPKGTLVLRNDAIIEEENCILCGLCERYCPDLAIEMIPSAVAAHAAKGKDARRLVPDSHQVRTIRRKGRLGRQLRITCAPDEGLEASADIMRTRCAVGGSPPPRPHRMTRKLTQGNEAVFRGAIAAGASYYAGYPISPSTEILNIASGWAAEHPEFGFLQAEDEIASANAVIGASLAGAKAFTATSGPGFSLMQEAIGYAQKVGVPSVFVDVQRVGPATGMPTMPGQGDILQVRYGSTGDYTPIAFYPNSVAEAFRLTVDAFNAAEESRSPVVLLSDTFVAHLNEVVDLDELAQALEVVPRSLAPLARHAKGSPRFFAGVLMYEHGPNAGEPATADADEYLRQYYEAKRRHTEVAARYARFEHGWKTDAEVLVICYGIVSRVAAPLRDGYALFRPIRIHPVLAEELRPIAERHREIVVVEANDGQYASMVELALHRPVRRVPLLGGRISLEAVRDGIERVLAGGPSEPPVPAPPTERVAPSPLGAS